MKTSEIIEKTRKLLKMLGKNSLRFFKKHYLALIALCISILGSSPITSRFLIYSLYEPKLDITIGGWSNSLKWSEIFFNDTIAGIAICNLDAERDMYVEIEFKASAPIKVRPQMETSFIERGFPSRSGFVYRMMTLHIPANGGGGPAFPFEPYNEEVTLLITVYPRMKMSHFGLPVFFGDIDLKPYGETFIIEL
jgi:hypothetical protein